MSRFAMIDSDNTVINIIEAESIEVAMDVTKTTCIADDGTALIGGTWNGKKFTAPVITE
jgi:hypothetical protein